MHEALLMRVFLKGVRREREGGLQRITLTFLPLALVLFAAGVAEGTSRQGHGGHWCLKSFWIHHQPNP